MNNEDMVLRKKEKFIDKKIKILTEYKGQKQKEEVQAKVIGNLAAHQGVTIPDYAVSEISTGLALFKGFRTIRDAMYVARYIYEIYGNVPVGSSQDALTKWGRTMATDVRSKFLKEDDCYFDCYNLPKGISSQGRKRANSQ